MGNRNFKLPSIFKPWVAEYIYEKVLPDGGIIVDPCMGWGGRFLGSIDGGYKYIGYDLNEKSVESHVSMRNYMGARVKNAPIFECVDSAVVNWPEADLLFTSPPYDNTECYYGLENPYEVTTPIYENIMKFDGTVALNVPKRHIEQCVAVAKKHGKRLMDEFRMITADPVGRRSLNYEPILVFK